MAHPPCCSHGFLRGNPCPDMSDPVQMWRHFGASFKDQPLPTLICNSYKLISVIPESPIVDYTPRLSPTFTMRSRVMTWLIEFYLQEEVIFHYVHILSMASRGHSDQEPVTKMLEPQVISNLVTLPYMPCLSSLSR